MQKYKKNYAFGYIKKVQSQGANGPHGEAEQQQVLSPFNTKTENRKIQKHGSKTCDCELALTPAYVINKIFNIWKTLGFQKCLN